MSFLGKSTIRIPFYQNNNFLVAHSQDHSLFVFFPTVKLLRNQKVRKSRFWIKIWKKILNSPSQRLYLEPLTRLLVREESSFFSYFLKVRQFGTHSSLGAIFIKQIYSLSLKYWAKSSFGQVERDFTQIKSTFFIRIKVDFLVWPSNFDRFLITNLQGPIAPRLFQFDQFQEFMGF